MQGHFKTGIGLLIVIAGVEIAGVDGFEAVLHNKKKVTLAEKEMFLCNPNHYKAASKFLKATGQAVRAPILNPKFTPKTLLDFGLNASKELEQFSKKMEAVAKIDDAKATAALQKVLDTLSKGAFGLYTSLTKVADAAIGSVPFSEKQPSEVKIDNSFNEPELNSMLYNWEIVKKDLGRNDAAITLLVECLKTMAKSIAIFNLQPSKEHAEILTRHIANMVLSLKVLRGYSKNYENGYKPDAQKALKQLKKTFTKCKKENETCAKTWEKTRSSTKVALTMVDALKIDTEKKCPANVDQNGTKTILDDVFKSMPTLNQNPKALTDLTAKFYENIDVKRQAIFEKELKEMRQWESLRKKAVKSLTAHCFYRKVELGNGYDLSSDTFMNTTKEVKGIVKGKTTYEKADLHSIKIFHKETPEERLDFVPMLANQLLFEYEEARSYSDEMRYPISDTLLASSRFSVVLVYKSTTLIQSLTSGVILLVNGKLNRPQASHFVSSISYGKTGIFNLQSVDLDEKTAPALKEALDNYPDLLVKLKASRIIQANEVPAAIYAKIKDVKFEVKFTTLTEDGRYRVAECASAGLKSFPAIIYCITITLAGQGMDKKLQQTAYLTPVNPEPKLPCKISEKMFNSTRDYMETVAIFRKDFNHLSVAAKERDWPFKYYKIKNAITKHMEGVTKILKDIRKSVLSRITACEAETEIQNLMDNWQDSPFSYDNLNSNLSTEFKNIKQLIVTEKGWAKHYPCDLQKLGKNVLILAPSYAEFGLKVLVSEMKRYVSKEYESWVLWQPDNSFALKHNERIAVLMEREKAFFDFANCKKCEKPPNVKFAVCWKGMFSLHTYPPNLEPTLFYFAGEVGRAIKPENNVKLPDKPTERTLQAFPVDKRLVTLKWKAAPSDRNVTGYVVREVGGDEISTKQTTQNFGYKDAATFTAAMKKCKFQVRAVTKLGFGPWGDFPETCSAKQ